MRCGLLQLRATAIGKNQLQAANAPRRGVAGDQPVSQHRPERSHQGRSIHEHRARQFDHRHRSIVFKRSQNTELRRRDVCFRQVPLIELGNMPGGLPDCEAVVVFE